MDTYGINLVYDLIFLQTYYLTKLHWLSLLESVVYITNEKTCIDQMVGIPWIFYHYMLFVKKFWDEICIKSFYFAGKYKLNLLEKAEWQYSEREKDNIEVCFTRTSRGNRIATMFVRCSPNARYTILHSHGNAVDLGQMSSFYMGLGELQVFGPKVCIEPFSYNKF